MLYENIKMGRWAYFSTGLEYKFWFGLQSSSDIIEFYGKENNELDDEYRGTKYVSWNSSIKENIKEDLDNLKKEHYSFLQEISWDSYELNLEGTTKLYHSFCENNNNNDTEEQNEISSKYLLGFLIYHQLLYTDVLECDYEY
jgi:hypothetical protein